MQKGKESPTKREGKANGTRSLHYFIQIMFTNVICEIPVILHFKLENKTAAYCPAYLSGEIVILSRPVTLTNLVQAEHDRPEITEVTYMYMYVPRGNYFFFPLARSRSPSFLNLPLSDPILCFSALCCCTYHSARKRILT